MSQQPERCSIIEVVGGRRAWNLAFGISLVIWDWSLGTWREPAISQLEHAIHPFRQIEGVGCHNQSHRFLLVQPDEQIGEALRRSAIERAGWFVGQQQPRL